MFKHGQRGSNNARRSRCYLSWVSMKQRCLNFKHQFYSNYGGRGIKVCKRWLQFENFYADMGERPRGKTLDRINVNKNYCKSNCKWSTKKQQESNKRRNLINNDSTTLLSR